MRGLRPAIATVVISAGISACNALTGIADFAVEPAPSDGGTETSTRADGAVAPSSTSSSASSSGVYDDGGGLLGPPILYPDASSSSSGGTKDAGAVDASDASVVVEGPCDPSTVGPRYPMLVGGFPNGWNSRTSILGPPDNQAARASATAQAMTVRVLGFAVPADAKILGITVELVRAGDLTTGSAISDDAISLTKGDPKDNGPWPDGTSNGPFTATTYGSDEDLWGATWTPAEINASSFGVTIKPKGEGFGFVESVAVSVRICTPPPPPPP